MTILFINYQPIVICDTTRCSDKREIWHGGTGPLPRAKFHVYRGKNVKIQPPKLSKF